MGKGLSMDRSPSCMGVDKLVIFLNDLMVLLYMQLALVFMQAAGIHSK